MSDARVGEIRAKSYELPTIIRIQSGDMGLEVFLDEGFVGYECLFDLGFVFERIESGIACVVINEKKIILVIVNGHNGRSPNIGKNYL